MRDGLSFARGFVEEDQARDVKFYAASLVTLEGEATDQLLNLPKELRLGMVRDEQRLRLAPETLGYCRARLEQILNATIDGGFAANVTRWRNNTPKKTRLLRQKNLEKGVRAAMLMMMAPIQTHMYLQLIAARWNTHQAHSKGQT